MNVWHNYGIRIILNQFQIPHGHTHVSFEATPSMIKCEISHDSSIFTSHWLFLSFLLASQKTLDWFTSCDNY